MEQEVKIVKLCSESEETSIPAEVIEPGRRKNKHLEGFSEDEKRNIKLIADIFVKSIMRVTKND